MLFSGASDLLSPIVKPLVSSSHDFSPLVISFQRSSFLSVHIFLTLLNFLFVPLFSSQRLWTRVDSPHLNSTCPFSSQHNRSDTVAFPFDHGFQHSIVLSYVIILVSCTVRSFNPTGLLTVTCGSRREELWCHEQPSVKSAREQHSRTRLWVLLPEKRNEQGHASSTAVRATGMQCSEAWQTQAAQPCALLPCCFPLHFQNVAIAIQLAKCLREGDVDRKVEKRSLDAQLPKVRGPKERSNGKHSPGVRCNNGCGKGTYRWIPDSQITSMQHSNKQAT